MMGARAGMEEARVATGTGEHDALGVQAEPRTDHIDGDDIQVIPGEPPRRRSRALIIGGAIVVIGLVAAIAVALRRDNTAKPRVIAEPPTTVVAKEQPNKAKSQSKSVSKPKPPAATPQTAAPSPPVASAAPPPTAAPAPTPAKLVATATPATATVRAGTPISVALRVTNQGGTTGQFVYDNDGCPGKELAPPPDQICTQIAAILNVAPGATVSKVVTIDTARAQPGVYIVRYDDGVAVKVTIIK
jgi:hypothetical protein